MSEEPSVEQRREVYVPPVLEEAGGFVARTRGGSNIFMTEGANNYDYWD
ncbi:lasso RiPP family leader peptide-containing protein [Streptomyces hoynatensis]|uniref:Lasso RiPP family leader peptide-containing protein n=1 Tax=Streptomyces hoynatensis TaxID=1141874 RepID=A0A3A9Z4N7_9ACTN|nr:lasso RiPP family leader peptide-containing protein [Streptomyces hoynatensis]RKN43180.1 lasso RiPP family leader peptide-containing protein [Streptomyces hoynatensis]